MPEPDRDPVVAALERALTDDFWPDVAKDIRAALPLARAQAALVAAALRLDDAQKSTAADGDMVEAQAEADYVAALAEYRRAPGEAE